MTDILDLTVRLTQGRRATKTKVTSRMPLALTKPGERWHLNAFCMTSVVVVRDGPAPGGHQFADDKHQVTVANFRTVRDAAAAVQGFNCLGVIADMWADELSPRDFHDRVGELLKTYGRV